MNKTVFYVVTMLISCMSSVLSGQTKDVVSVLDSLISLSDSTNARELVMKKGLYLKSIMRYDEAAEVFASLLQDGVSDSEAVAEVAECNYMDGNYNGARVFYTMLFTSDPGNIVSGIRLMQMSYKTGEYRECIRFGRAVLEQDSIPAVYSLLGDAFKRTEQRDSALACYQEALRLRPLYPDVIAKVSDMLFEAGDYDGVIAMTDSYLSEKPDNVMISSVKGMAQYMKKDYQASMETFSRIRELGDDSYKTHLMLGQSLWQLDRIYEADEELMKAYAVDSTEVRLVLLIASVKADLLAVRAGHLKEGSKAYPEMEAWFDKALAMMEPDGKMMSEIWRRRGYAYYKLASWQKARKCYEAASEYDIPDARSYLYLGYCCQMEQEWKDALQYYMKGLELSEQGTQLSKYLQERVEDMEKEVFMYEN